MTIYVGDGQLRGEIRRWQDIVGNHTPIPTNKQEWEGYTFSTGDVIILHQYDEHDASACMRNAAVVIISGGGYGTNQESTSENRNFVYYRRAGVLHGDKTFGSMIANFAQYFLRTSDRMWSLLEPQCPEHVLACYLCALTSVSPDSSWKNEFENEISYFVKVRSISSKLTWDNSTDMLKLREFLKATGTFQG